MLVFDFHKIGNKLFISRKSLGMTQADVAEKAGLSDRTYADIERGTVNMRIETLLRICEVLHITPDEILTEQVDCSSITLEEIVERLNKCTPIQRENSLRILSVFLDSLE